MTIDLEHFARSLDTLGDARAVMEKAREYLDAWPDPYRLAHEQAAAYLLEHTGKPLDPDRVWWHEFDLGVSAPTFTGWQHSGPPRHSMRFTRLLIHRFSGGFQAAPDTLPVFGGFYTRGPEVDQYGADNELELSPQKVMDDLWALDFAAVVNDRVARFWGEQGPDFPVLAKAQFIAQIDQGVQAGTLAAVDRQHLRAWLGLSAGAPLTLTALSSSSHSTQMRVRHFTPGNGHLLILWHASGRTVLYAPTLKSPLRGFASHADMVRWLNRHLAGDDGPAWLEAVYRMDPQTPADRRESVLQSVRQRSGSYTTPKWPFGDGIELVLPDLFDTLLLWAKADLNLTLHNLVSNAELRRQLWRGYLGAFLQVFGSFALMAWPIGLAMLGASVTRLVLDVEAAVNARSSHERNQAILASLGDAVMTAFLIIDTGLGLKALQYRDPPHFSRLLPNLLQPARDAARARQLLASLDSNRIVLEPGPASGRLQGLQVDEQGSTWIELDEMSLPVSYNTSWASWMVLSDLDSLELRESLLVRRGLDGRWRLYAPDGNVDALATQFWDTYMEPDHALSDRLSRALLDRQTRLLEQAALPEFTGNMTSADAFGHHYVEVQGRRFYTFKQEGEFHNDLAMEYSSHMARINDLFRGDRSRLQNIAEQELLDFIDTFANALEQLPKSKAALLWRGGRGSRVPLAARYRQGAINAGDLLVTTDITSFTENPYIPRRFMLPQDAANLPLAEVSGHFDEHTVLYELAESEQLSGAPISPLSLHWQEAEVLFMPGRTFRIDEVAEVQGQHYRFIRFKLREVPRPAGESAYDLRSGQPFDRRAYAERVGNAPWVERFFPAEQWP
ncbi:dermonecrotic toxin domain-containing protein [Pseudomonas sp. GZD-222]|uniref:dermonecrotic toxin domain-containing protein n=1 Tax=Pseudomonas sp. GZD-222 TaxID=3404805 RepID=UPI003BB59688